MDFFDRHFLGKRWLDISTAARAQLHMHGHAALPRIHGIEESYLVIAKAKDFVQNVLMDDNKKLRHHVFEDNVRAYLGEKNKVNDGIAETIKRRESSTRFPVLNNGITIVSPDVSTQGNTLNMESFQIVNGCQTSNILFNNYEDICDDMMLTLKVVETNNEDVFSDIVSATNNQTKVDDVQFYSVKPVAKRIEQYFKTYPKNNSIPVVI